jgi:nucleotide-binding universal stress UspA family protein
MKTTAINKILVPVDFSGDSKAALEYAVFLAKGYGATITALHVNEPPPHLSNEIMVQIPGEPDVTVHEYANRRAQADLDELVKGVEGAEIETMLLEGNAVDQILRTAEEGYGLMVIAARHARWWEVPLLGSIAEKLLRAAPCPVLAYPEGCHDQVVFHSILVPTDFSDLSKEVVDAAADLAETLHAKMILLHVNDLPIVVGNYYPMFRVPGGVDAEAFKTLGDTTAAELDRWAEKYRARGIETEARVVEGHPAEEIVKAAEQADLVAMATQGRRGIARLLLGSVAERVLRTTNTPVFAAPPRVLHEDVGAAKDEKKGTKPNKGRSNPPGPVLI